MKSTKIVHKIRNLILNHFGFSKSETNGFLVLLVLMLLIVSLPYLYQQVSSGNHYHKSRDQKILDSLVISLEKKLKVPSTPQFVPELFSFDPNSLSKEEFEKMGLNHFIINNIIKYRDKGGTFNSKKDLKKIYGMNDSIYARIKGYIKLPKEKIRKISETVSNEIEKSGEIPPETENTFKKKIIKFDVNTADTSHFKQIYGIGSILSSRIIKYRALLGGFVNIDQYKEIYGLDAELIEKLEQNTLINDSFIPEKILINFAEVKDLVQHPYITYSISKSIVNHRIKHGPFKNLSDLKKIPEVNDQLINKLKPYLKL